ncbi:MAG: hypothetical protein KBT31_06140 [Firmicutes bacterium]|nr:hypothetical protein [Candidatus Colimorpha enterica]
MKPKIIILSAALIIAAALFLYIDFNSYAVGSKTVDHTDGGLILSITAFDGKNESEPFVKCLGHAWISIENKTGHPVRIMDNEVKDCSEITFSVWAISDHFGVVFNLEPHFISEYGRYVGRKSLSVNIDETKLEAVEDYIARNDRWELGKNCSYWSIGLWNEVVGDAYRLKTQTLVYTPTRLIKSLDEYDCVETDRDFSDCGEIFFYINGERTELDLCS